MGETMIGLFILIAVIIAIVLGTIFIAVPLFRGVGLAIGGIFRGISWLLAHIAGFIVGMVRDVIRLVGSVIAWIVFLPFMCLNVVIGRWSATGHFFRAMKRECQVASACIYRILLQRPLRFLLLGGLLEGIEDRLDEAVAAAPPADKPSSRTGKFDGYKIIGSLPVGGSGAKLYIAEPDKQMRAKHADMPAKVVIKTFALSDGSSLPQIVRESRALEAAKQLGLVLDHGMDDQRFFYIMPYHDGDHLSIVARQLHAESDGDGLAKRQLATAMSYVQDLLLTLREYHHAGLWHKDVKPENIIIHDGRAHLVDLGLVTPLRSAMTLTTHGTEYFRDPEMVRQALRGVKVHQVDGTKFDIYAVGAVMYYLLENTFPAHGGLSRFGRKSPEALRWIVRRAMTEYNQRYATVDQMLADIRYVMASPDAVGVKPMNLPSMQGGAAQAEAIREAEAAAADDASARESQAKAGSAVPPNSDGKKYAGVSFGGFGFVAGKGPNGPYVKVGKLNQEDTGATEPPAPGPVKSTKPKLRVINWWTGAYVPDGPMERAGASQARAASPNPRAAGARVFVPAGARRPASEQVAAARERASSMRSRVSQRRSRLQTGYANTRHVHSRREPSAIVGLAVMATIVVGGLFYLRHAKDNGGNAVIVDSAVIGGAPEAYAAALPGIDAAFAHVPMLVINDHPAKTNPAVEARIGKFLDECTRRGLEFIVDDVDAEARVRQQLPTGELGAKTTFRPEFGELMHELHIGGVLLLTAGPGEAAPQDRLRAVWIFNHAEGGDDGPVEVQAQTIPAVEEFNMQSAPDAPGTPSQPMSTATVASPPALAISNR